MLLPAFSSVIATSQVNPDLPNIDGVWAPNEWPNIAEYTFTDQVKVQFSYRLNTTYFFFTARYKDESPTHTAFQQDAFAIGFDNNGDQTNMGSISSPDDAVFIGFGNYAIDVYMQGIGKHIVKDVDVGGINNSYGRYSLANNYYTYEFVKPLNSGDTKGNDIKLAKGDSISIMLAYWDNLPPFSEISGFTDWITLKAIDPFDSSFTSLDYLLPLTLALVFSSVLITVRIKTRN